MGQIRRQPSLTGASLSCILYTVNCMHTRPGHAWACASASARIDSHCLSRWSVLSVESGSETREIVVTEHHRSRFHRSRQGHPGPVPHPGRTLAARLQLSPEEAPAVRRTGLSLIGNPMAPCLRWIKASRVPAWLAPQERGQASSLRAGWGSVPTDERRWTAEVAPTRGI